MVSFVVLTTSVQLGNRYVPSGTYIVSPEANALTKAAVSSTTPLPIAPKSLTVTTPASGVEAKTTLLPSQRIILECPTEIVSPRPALGFTSIGVDVAFSTKYTLLTLGT